MTTENDAHNFAACLVAELGERAIRLSRVRLVELTAASDLRAAAFWRDVMRASEQLLARPPDGAARPCSALQ
ncbi:hypothetical protein M2352_003153 [Azospirillum fermentarium]|uniref:hypothetical protein n=1 Tax=Azospirillum fermentarium TaxID=1233114 RepID=UPI0022269381|nr:hypothetical protein [Azospirillum fermentarium]MCW2247519.1 hypothetical protein [Azospirillum fermentarium]